MLDQFCKLINIEKNEKGPVFFCGLMLATSAAGKAIGWPAVQSILMKRFGFESLPYSFVIFSVAGMIGSFLYMFFADMVRREVLLKIFCAVTGSVLILSFFFIPSSFTGEVTTGLIICASLVLAAYGLGYATIGFQIWTIINDTFRPSQGVRLYPVITIATFIGGVVGSGLLLPVLVKIFNTKSLIAFWGLFIVAQWPIIYIFERFYGRQGAYNTGYFEVRKSIFNLWNNLKSGVGFSLRSPLVQMIACICVLFWTVASLKEFQYGKVVNATFKSEEELTKYYGYYTTVLEAVVLVLQITFTGKAVKKIGVGFGLCLLPLTIFSGMTFVWIYYSFLSAFVMRVTWDLVAMTVQGSSYQLSFNAVPAPYRGRVRGFLEGFVNPLGGILGGIIIITINRSSYFSSSTNKHQVIITVLCLLFTLVWIFISYKTRERYYKAILENLKSSDERTYQDALEMMEEAKFIGNKIGNLVKQRDIPYEILKGEKVEHVLTEEADQEKIVLQKKTVLRLIKKIINEKGKIILYCTRKAGCRKAKIIIDNNYWDVRYTGDKITIKDDKSVANSFDAMIFDKLHWELETGYIVILFDSKRIICVEIGDYPKRYATQIICKTKGFVRPLLLQQDGKNIDPLKRFLSEIKPFSHSVLTSV